MPRRRWFRFRPWEAVFAVPIGVLSVMLFRGCADFAILHPTTYVIDVPGATPKDLPVPGPGGTVEVFVQRTPGCGGRDPAAYVLRFCGNGERAEDAIGAELQRWARFPVEVWAENHPGYGRSSTPCTLSSLAPAALAAYDALAHLAAHKPIFVTGISLGTTDALYVAANRPVDGLILHNPPPLRELIVGAYAGGVMKLLAPAVSRQVPADLDSMTNARRSRSPAVFLLADHDTVVPPKFQKMVYDAYAGPKRRIDLHHAGHNTPVYGAAEQQLQAEMDWLWNTAILADQAAPKR